MFDAALASPISNKGDAPESGKSTARGDPFAWGCGRSLSTSHESSESAQLAARSFTGVVDMPAKSKPSDLETVTAMSFTLWLVLAFMGVVFLLFPSSLRYGIGAPGDFAEVEVHTGEQSVGGLHRCESGLQFLLDDSRTPWAFHCSSDEDWGNTLEVSGSGDSEITLKGKVKVPTDAAPGTIHGSVSGKVIAPVRSRVHGDQSSETFGSSFTNPRLAVSAPLEFEIWSVEQQQLWKRQQAYIGLALLAAAIIGAVIALRVHMRERRSRLGSFFK